MSELFWLSESQLKLIEPYFPPSRGVARVDDLRVISGIIHVLKRGLQHAMTAVRTLPAPPLLSPLSLYGGFNES
ncbi:MAG: hypothetical protein KDJ26_09175 [Alphaproteobacteria bacterium]|nr:hypothetical protein [Alphaproteobacteria bacterium]